MSWEETRQSARTVVSTARAVAHSDDAKHRVDEGSDLAAAARTRPRGAGLPKWLLPVGAVAALVLGGGAVALVNTSSEPKPAPATTSASPTPSEAAVSLADTEPTGKFNVTMRRVVSQPSTQTMYPKRLKDVWTFESAGCSETECIGQMSSRLDGGYQYTWTGSTLLLSMRPDIYNKAECVSDVTGVHEADSGFVSMRLDYQTQPVVPLAQTPLTAPPDALETKLGYRWTYKRWWPRCSQKPKDAEYVQYVVKATKRS